RGAVGAGRGLREDRRGEERRQRDRACELGTDHEFSSCGDWMRWHFVVAALRARGCLRRLVRPGARLAVKRGASQPNRRAAANGSYNEKPAARRALFVTCGARELLGLGRRRLRGLLLAL